MLNNSFLWKICDNCGKELFVRSAKTYKYKLHNPVRYYCCYNCYVKKGGKK